MTKISEIKEDSSSSFSDDSEENRVRKLARHMLKSSLFIGTFLEKRFVEPLNSYRAVIKVSNEESEFIDNLMAVRKRCMKFFSKNMWIGITEPKTIGAPAGYNLWVNLDEEVFGSYWYKVKNVDFVENEVRLRLEVVRPVTTEKTPIHNVTAGESVNDVSNGDLLKSSGAYFKQKLNDLFTETLTWPNIKQSVVFIVLLISTILTFALEAVKYLMDYLLKLIHEFSGLVNVCSPIIINFMKLIANTVNGFYHLIAFLWTDSSRPKINQHVYQISPYDLPNYNLKALPPVRDTFRKKRSSVKITPLD